MEQRIEKLAEWVDDLLPFKKLLGGIKGVIFEAVDGKLFIGLFGYAYSKVPSENRPEVDSFIDAILNKDYEKLKTLSTERIVDILKTPLGDAREKIIVGAQVEMICALMQYEIDQVVEAQGNEKEDESVGGGGPGGDPDDGK